MFSRLVSSVRSTLSPKAWLARSLARALNDFFVLEVEDNDAAANTSSTGSSGIESNLLTDTKIVLSNAKVRPRQLDQVGRVWLEGQVEEIEFLWTWGGGGGASSSSAFVRDTRLTIRGANFRIRIKGTAASAAAGTGCSSSPSPPTAAGDSTAVVVSDDDYNSSSSATNNFGYIQRQIQQILDHLTLNITDFTLDIVDDDDDNNIGTTIKLLPLPSEDDDAAHQNYHGVRIQAKALQLASFGRLQEQISESYNVGSTEAASPPSPPLSQRISLDSIRIDLLAGEGTSSSSSCGSLPPVLEPIGFAASVKRVSGRRFMDGWMTGLEIVGEVLQLHHQQQQEEEATSSSSSATHGGGVVIHAETNHISTLNRLFKKLAASTATATTTTSSGGDGYGGSVTSTPTPEGEVMGEPTPKRQQQYEDHKNEKPKTLAEQQQQQQPCSTSSPITTMATTLSLPLPPVSIILPRGTTIQMPGCTFCHSMDGSQSMLLGRQGINVGGKPFLAFDDTDNESSSSGEVTGKNEWRIDFVQHKISLVRRSQEDEDKEEGQELEGSVPPSTPATNDGTIVMARVEWDDSIFKQLFHEYDQILPVVVSSSPEIVTSTAEREEEFCNESLSSYFRNTTTTTKPCCWLFESGGAIAMKVSCQENHWVQAKLLTPRVAIARSARGGISFQNLQVGGIEIGPTSFGQRKSSLVRISSMVLERNDHNTGSNDDDYTQTIVVKHGIDANLESIPVLYQLQDFGKRLCTFGTTSESTGSAATSSSTADTGTNTSTSLDLVLPSLQIPKISFQLQEEAVQLDIGPTMMKPTPWDRHCPFRVKTQELRLRGSRASSVFSLSSADLLVAPAEGGLSIDLNGETMVRIADTRRWIESTIGPVSVDLDHSSSSIIPKRASGAFLKVGPCSWGQLSLTVPSIELCATNVIKFGELSGTIESPEILRQAQGLLRDCFPANETASTTVDLSWVIPKVVLAFPALKAKVVAELVRATSVTCQVTCQRFGCQDETGMAAAFHGLQVQLVPEFSATVAGIDAFFIPDLLGIERPINEATVFAFVGDTLHVGMPTIHVTIFGYGAGQGAPPSSANVGLDLDLPFPFRVSFPQTTVRSFSQDGAATRLSLVELSVTPQARDPFATGSQPVDFQAVIAAVENKVLKLGRTVVSGIVNPNNLSTVHRFKVATEGAEVTAGLSSLDWASVFGTEEQRKQSKPISLPMATVDAFEVNLTCKGSVVAIQKMAVAVPAYCGGAQTDSDALTQHVKQAVIGRFPTMLANTEILGENIAENAAKTAGRVLLAAKSATGAATGSVVGLVASDTIGASVTAGKQSRNAEVSDGYQFGDFTRGAISSISKAAKSGAQVRRGTSEAYQVGDFAVGASTAAANYASENKSRLGAAGGSGMGMVVGCALAGPIGLVAGSFLGSKLGGSAFEDSSASANDIMAEEKEKEQASQITKQKQLEQRLMQEEEAALIQAMQASMSPTENQGVGDDDMDEDMKLAMMLSMEDQSQAGQALQHQRLPHQQQQAYPSGNLGQSQGAQRMQRMQHQQQQDHTGNSLQAQHRMQHQARRQQQQVSHQQQQQSHSSGNLGQTQGAQGRQQQLHQAHQQQGYRFGDLTRSVIAKGKEKSGRLGTESYKFGDFTRGLFK